MLDRIHLEDTEEVITLLYEKYLLSRKTLHWDDKITRLNLRCEFCGGGHQSSYCEGPHIRKEEQQVINIDYYSPLEIILDEFLRSNQASFDKFQVQYGNLDEIISECEKKLVELETKCHTMVVNEKPQVRGVDLYLKSETQPMRLKDIIQFLKDTYSSPWWESSNSKSLTMGAWDHLLLCMKFMEFLPNKRKKKDDVFFQSYLPP